MWIVHRDLAAAWLEPVTLVDLTERDAFQTSGDRIMFCFSWAQRAEEFWAMKRCQWSWTNVDQMDKSKRWTWKFWMLLADATNPTRLPRMPLMEPNVSFIFGASQPHIFGPGGSIVVVLPVVPRLWRGPRTAGLAEDHEWHAGGVWSKKKWKRGFGGWWIFQGISRGISHDSVWGWIRKSIQTLL